MSSENKMTVQMSSAATDNGQSPRNANSIADNLSNVKHDFLTAEEQRLEVALKPKLSEYLAEIGMLSDGGGGTICPSCCGMAILFPDGEWMCDDCGCGGNIVDYAVAAHKYPNRKEAIRGLSRQFGIKRTELELLPADVLMKMEFPERPDIIKDFLIPGLTMLYGSPKVGKSWLVLQIAVAVSKGEEFFGRPTRKGKVVYLALEDTFRRLKSRLTAQTDTIDCNLQFVIESEILGGGLEGQLENLMRAHPDTKLIIIDTFQRIRDPNNNSYSYADDYREMEILKQFAYQHEIAVILVHHKRKMKANDPLDEVSGTNGLTGCADTLMILSRKKRTGRTGKLIVSGRDIPGEELKMTFSDESMMWELNGTVEDENGSDRVIDAVVRFMSDRERWSGTATELIGELSMIDGEIEIKPNRLSAVLLENQNELLSENGIAIEKDRTNSRKVIILTRKRNDLGVSDDGLRFSARQVRLSLSTFDG